jgi:integrase/recombinase XerD
VSWAKSQGVTTLEGIDPPLVRRYLDHLHTRATRTGRPLDSFTIHGHIRAIRTLLFWAASEDLIDEKIPKRIHPLKKEKKLVRVLSEQQVNLLFEAAKKTDAPLRDTIFLSLLYDTGCCATELCTLVMDNVIMDSTAPTSSSTARGASSVRLSWANAHGWPCRGISTASGRAPTRTSSSVAKGRSLPRA